MLRLQAKGDVKLVLFNHTLVCPNDYLVMGVSSVYNCFLVVRWNSHINISLWVKVYLLCSFHVFVFLPLIPRGNFNITSPDLTGQLAFKHLLVYQSLFVILVLIVVFVLLLYLVDIQQSINLETDKCIFIYIWRKSTTIYCIMQSV